MTLKKLREAHNLTQKDVSELADIPIAVVRNYEQGKSVAQEHVNKVDKFIVLYDRYIDEARDLLAVFQRITPNTPIVDGFGRYPYEVAKYDFKRWLDNLEVLDTEPSYTIIFRVDKELPYTRYVVHDLNLANFAAKVMHENNPDMEVVVGELEKTEDYYNELGDNFRWNRFKAYGQHPTFYNSHRD